MSAWLIPLLASAGCKNPSIGSSPGAKAPLEPGLSRVEVLQVCDLAADTAVPAHPTSPRCLLATGQKFKVRSPTFLGTFLRVEVADRIEGCSLTAGYLPSQAVRIVEGPQAVAMPAAGPTVSSPVRTVDPVRTAVPPARSETSPSKAFLDVIAYAEGTRGRGNDGYNVIFSFQYFSTYADHPRRRVCSGICSDAAGRYQFLSTTWDGVRRNQGLDDFSPPNQDKGGLYLARQRGVSNYDQALSQPAFETAIRKLGKEWASLPGSPYGQPVKTMSELWRVYRQVLTK